jgi:hypothetical protein
MLPEEKELANIEVSIESTSAFKLSLTKTKFEILLAAENESKALLMIVIMYPFDCKPAGSMLTVNEF